MIESLDLASKPMGVVDLLLGGSMAIAVAVSAVAVGAGGSVINLS
jgi:hypothetical protein